MPRRRLTAALVVVAVVAVSCSVAPASSQRSSTSSSTMSAPSTTTTSLPVPVAVPGSSDQGPDSFLRTAERVDVAPVPPGATASSLPVAGTPAYLHMVRIAFRRFGSGPALLLIGGVDMTMSYWDPSWLSLLAQHFTVVTFDLPGTGFSTPVTAATLQSWADDTAGLIDALGLVKPVVLGWGLGGDVALELAESHPYFLRALVLAETPAGEPEGVPTPAATIARLASRWLSLAGLASIWFGPGEQAARTTWLAGEAEVLPDVLSQPARREQLAAAAAVQVSESLWANLSLVTVPTLVVSGSNDSVVPPQNAQVLAAGISGASSLVVPGGDYAALFEDGPALIAAMERLVS